ncbi:hypothetical protein Q0601_23180 [Paracoccus onubensis]|uniref:hypothetical protein n=1 Tax=Paracoccus onubensis TaxID=1675788 RepID=UPI0027310F7B|nr:hypothetical protein [Paracoccus onubensis]MDP0930089.1 hypothetical protein [Paracoccus onubensis]
MPGAGWGTGGAGTGLGVGAGGTGRGTGTGFGAGIGAGAGRPKIARPTALSNSPTARALLIATADARDLIANGKALLWDKRYNELVVWVGVFACLIGLIPSLGSLAKGVIKIIWKNAGEMGRVLIYINKALHRTGVAKINGYRFVKKLGDEVVSRVGEVSQKFDEFLDFCASKASFLVQAACSRVLRPCVEWRDSNSTRSRQRSVPEYRAD